MNSDTVTLDPLLTALHHNFSEIHTYDAHQARAAGALGLAPVSIGP